MRIELDLCNQVLLREINNPKTTRNDLAVTYALALQSTFQTDWKKINEAIIERWSLSALKYIKDKAWKVATS